MDTSVQVILSHFPLSTQISPPLSPFSLSTNELTFLFQGEPRSNQKRISTCFYQESYPPTYMHLCTSSYFPLVPLHILLLLFNVNPSTCTTDAIITLTSSRISLQQQIVLSLCCTVFPAPLNHLQQHTNMPSLFYLKNRQQPFFGPMFPLLPLSPFTFHCSVYSKIFQQNHFLNFHSYLFIHI